MKVPNVFNDGERKVLLWERSSCSNLPPPIDGHPASGWIQLGSPLSLQDELGAENMEKLIVRATITYGEGSQR